MTESEQENLFKLAWRILGDALTKGEIHLPERDKPLPLTPKDVIMVAQHLASKRPPRISKVPKLDNLLLKQTGE